MNTIERFVIRRADGRSNAQVLCDCVGKREPGSIVSYDELSEALSQGTDTEYTKTAVQCVVRLAGPKLGAVHKRALHNVRGTGYRMALASEHVCLSLDRQTKAQRQIKRGVEILRDTRLEEIRDPEARKAHEGMYMLAAGMYGQMTALGQRVARIENAIDRAINVPVA